MTNAAPSIPLKQRLAARGLDGLTLLVVPAILFVLLLFIYPFLYGLFLSFEPKAGGVFANYQRFFSDSFLYGTIATTLWLALPVTIVTLALAIPIAFRVRLMRNQRLLTTILVIPITLGTVLVAEGLLNYLGPQGWFNRTLMTLGIISSPVKLLHNYWGVMLSLVITGFPFTFLLTLSYLSASIRPWRMRARRWARDRGSASSTSSSRCCCRGWRSPSASASCRPSRSFRRRCCSRPRRGRRASSRSQPIRQPSRNTITPWPRRSR